MRTISCVVDECLLECEQGARKERGRSYRVGFFYLHKLAFNPKVARSLGERAAAITVKAGVVAMISDSVC